MDYDARRWIWVAEDGRVFATPSCRTVDKTDPDYLAFVGAGNIPNHWPRDETGAQTAAALDEVLTRHGLSTSGPIRLVTGAQLIGAMTDDQVKAWQAAVAAARMSVQSYWAGAYRDLLPAGNPKLVRLAAAAGVDLGKLYDAVLGPAAPAAA